MTNTFLSCRVSDGYVRPDPQRKDVSSANFSIYFESIVDEPAITQAGEKAKAAIELFDDGQLTQRCLSVCAALDKQFSILQGLTLPSFAAGLQMTCATLEGQIVVKSFDEDIRRWGAISDSQAKDRGREKIRLILRGLIDNQMAMDRTFLENHIAPIGYFDSLFAPGGGLEPKISSIVQGIGERGVNPISVTLGLVVIPLALRPNRPPGPKYYPAVTLEFPADAKRTLVEYADACNFANGGIPHPEAPQFV